MNKESMLKETCLLELGVGGRKAVGRVRGFSAAEISTPEFFQQAFLTDRGVATALSRLTPDEIRFLHLMSFEGQPVGLPFFDGLYKPAAGDYWISFNERYKGVFQQVKSRLIAQGILLTGTEPEGYHKTGVLERRRFLFPDEFAGLLPPLLEARELETGARPATEPTLLRRKLLEILEPSTGSGVPPGAAKSPWQIEKGQLLMGGQPFSETRLKNWQLASFATAAGYAKRERDQSSPITLLWYAFSRLKASEWAGAEGLLPFWKLALPKAKLPEPQATCDLGCDWECLEKSVSQGASYYRLRADKDLEAGLSPESYFETGDPKIVCVHLESIPFKVLEQLGRVANFQIQAGSLRVNPDLIKIGHASLDILEAAWFQWLQSHHPAFGEASKTCAARRGKLIVHHNLLIARVRDLSLKVMIEKKLGGPGRLVSLSPEYLAFPADLLSEIQPLLKKSGHVLKAIRAENAE
jgi:hypothetical protein